MDRRTFMRKVGELAGISAAGISLSKLQIATVATGLSSLLTGCSQDSVDDPLAENFSEQAPAGTLATCEQTDFVCAAAATYTCSDDFTCPSLFECPSVYDCTAINTCGTKHDCLEYFSCSSLDAHSCIETFCCQPVPLYHDQGGVILG